MAHFRSSRALAVLALAPLLSCHCNTKVRSTTACASEANVDPGNQGTCGSNADCSDHYQCVTPKDNASLQCCLNEPRSCNTDADCCPGQQCNTQAKECFDKFLDCSQGGNAACGNADGGGDFVCTPWTDNYGTSQRCTLQPCTALGGCPQDGQSCFQGQCISTLPCGGSCPSGDGCVPEVGVMGWCQQWACPVSCAPGYIATFTDDVHIWDTCNLPAEKCACTELPPLYSGDLGRFSAIAADTTASTVLVSMYDGQYGDLVVNRYDATGKLQKQQYLDGVPDSGTIVYGPSGPRGGITDPGPDVGRYSDIAVNGQYAYVSYYDYTNGALKLAVRQPDGVTWNLMQVDGANANVGLYSSVAVDSDGYPGISYFQLGGKPGYMPTGQCATQAGGTPAAFITALKFARATKANPASAADFDVVTLGCQGRPVQACYGCTGICADPGSGPSCYQAGTGCSGCDPNTQVCVTVGTTPTCANKYNPSQLAQTPDGIGVFSKLAFQGKTAYVAYQQRTSGAGVLYGISLNASDAPSAPVLVDGSDDTGYFPDVEIDASNHVLMTYMDWTNKALRFYKGTGFVAGTTPQTVDPGSGGPGSGVVSYVGMSSTLAIAPSGDVYVAYEDATHNNLNLAVQKANTSTWTVLPPLLTAGAVGFFADGAFIGHQLFVSSASLHAKSVAGAPALDNKLVLATFTAP